MKSVTINGKVCMPAIVRGYIAPKYYVSPDGDIWSTVRSALNPTKMTPCLKGGNTYPKSNVHVYGEKINIYFHRVVCETLVPFPVPEDISKEDWKSTPESVKAHIKSLYDVNHKDHDRTNFHPSNLEWVTAKGNAKAYQLHKANV
jgi:hypothetical protein